MRNIMIFSSVLLSFLSVLTVNASDAKFSLEPDTVAVADTLSADSIVKSTLVAAADSIATDSLTAVADTLTADSTAKAPVSVRNAVTTVLASRDTYDPSWKTPLSVVNKISDKDRALLISYYKGLIKADHSPEAYVKAYSPWREAFMGSNDRSLDLYIDGVGIIIANIDADTLKREGERIGMLADDLMELYDLAVKNVDDLNAQIDFTKTKDSITVAKLRAQQVRYFRRFFEIDSTFNADHHNNVFTAENEKYWEDVMFKDTTQMEILYPWYLELINSPDTDIDITHIAHFAKLLHIKTAKESKRYGAAYAKENFLRDRALAEAKATVLLENADPFEIIKSIDMSQKDYYASQFRGIETTFNMTAGGFIAGNDYAAMEEHYAKRLNDEGASVMEEILASNLQYSDSSDVYIRVLKDKYELEPSFDVAIKLAGKMSKLKKYHKNAMNYYEIAFNYPEFDELSSYRQARYYYLMSQFLLNAKQNKKCFEYIDLAKSICPEYPEPYYLEVALFQRLTSGLGGLNGHFSYIVQYDLYSNVKKLIEDLKAKGSTEVETKLEVDEIEKQMRECYARFPKKTTEEIFMGKYSVGQKHSIRVQGRTYSATIRVID